MMIAFIVEECIVRSLCIVWSIESFAFSSSYAHVLV